MPGSALASVGVCNPPIHGAPLDGKAASACAPLSSSTSMPAALPRLAQRCHRANSAGSRVKLIRPVRRKPRSVSRSACHCSQIARLRTIKGSSRRSLPCCRTQPQLRLDCSAATKPFSNNTTRKPRLVRCSAADTPATPAPMMMASAMAGRLALLSIQLKGWRRMSA